MKAITLIIGLSVALLVSIDVRGQEDYFSHPGFVNLDDIEIPSDASEVTEVTIGPELLEMMSMFSDEADEDFEELKGFVAIHVKSFDIHEKDFESVRASMEKIEKKLKSQDWKQLIRVKKMDEFTNISMKYDKTRKKSLGLMIMSLDPGEDVSFVNIVGNIDIKRLGKMGIGVNSSTLDSLKDAVDDL